MKTAYHGNQYIGLFGKANDKVVFLPHDANKSFFYAVKERMGAEVVKTSILQSNLIGVYMALTESFAILPHDIPSYEEEVISQHVEVVKIKSRFNAWGNNIVVGKSVIANPHIGENEIKKIEDALGKEVFRKSIAGYSTVGSLLCRTSKGFVVHYKASDEEMRFLEDALGVRGSRATVNMGNGFVSIGMMANSKGYVVGEGTTGIEIARIEEGLGYLEG
ncbi:MAG: translation initiation factor IF-6 [Candidatus Anstonellales archaeon]